MSMSAMLVVAMSTGVLGAEHGVQWHADTAVRQPSNALTMYGPETIPHGACGCGSDAMMLVRQDQLTISASPFVTYHGAGMHDYARAQHLALREMGLIQSVRTHTRVDRKPAPRKEIEPRAVIHIKERHQRPDKIEANANTRPSTQLVRVVRPGETRVASK